MDNGEEDGTTFEFSSLFGGLHPPGIVLLGREEGKSRERLGRVLSPGR